LVRAMPVRRWGLRALIWVWHAVRHREEKSDSIGIQNVQGRRPQCCLLQAVLGTVSVPQWLQQCAAAAGFGYMARATVGTWHNAGLITAACALDRPRRYCCMYVGAAECTRAMLAVTAAGLPTCPRNIKPRRFRFTERWLQQRHRLRQ
jgi:hypothetical protein